MKKSILFTLIFSLLVSIFTFDVVAESQTNEGKALNYKYESPKGMEISSPSAILIDAKTGTVLYYKNQDEKRSPASVTKIMTLLLVCEAIEDEKIKLDDTVAISQNAASMGGSQVFLEEGESFSVEELLKCTVIASANDAAVALAELISGNEGNFVAEMNKRAKELGMKNTNFENTTGLDDTTTNHITSAEDIAIMSKELVKHDIILKYSSLWQDSIRNGEFILTNTNRLVRFYDGCNGLKTGSTDKAGFCVSASAKRGEMQLIAVIMGAQTRDKRNMDARALLDYGFSNFALYNSEEKPVERIRIKRGVLNDIDAYVKDFSTVVNRADIKKVEISYEIPEFITAPLKADSIVGKVIYKIDNKEIGTSDIYINEDVESINFWQLFKKIIESVLA